MYIIQKRTEVINLNLLPVFLSRFIKFALVGTSGLVIDFGITYLLKEKLKIYKFLASSIGFTLAASSNYIINRIWTFHSTNPQIFYEYSSFLIISVFGLVINNLVLWIFNENLKINFYYSKIIATLVTTIWNFLANFYITFN